MAINQLQMAEALKLRRCCTASPRRQNYPSLEELRNRRQQIPSRQLTLVTRRWQLTADRVVQNMQELLTQAWIPAPTKNSSCSPQIWVSRRSKRAQHSRVKEATLRRQWRSCLQTRREVMHISAC